ncbi:MAG: Crp/Fnr family transcriptional regulator [Sphingomonas bacterium]|nr:Crp/Fnr family transcriptional regulator [Sphingomonas bacterium]
MSRGNAILMPLADKLQRLANLSASDVEAILALPHRVRTVRNGEHLVRQGDRADRCSLLLSGWASRQRMTRHGSRQILAIHVTGDFVDLQNALLGTAHDDVQALSEAEVAMVPREAIVDLAFAHPAVGKLLWTDTLIDASIAREWTVNVGRRDARTRVLHLLCELYERQRSAGLASDDGFELPLSQEELGDATGLTAVHVNRTLQALRYEGLFEREKRTVRIMDLDSMKAEADFNPTYLTAGE